MRTTSKCNKQGIKPRNGRFLYNFWKGVCALLIPLLFATSWERFHNLRTQETQMWLQSSLLSRQGSVCVGQQLAHKFTLAREHLFASQRQPNPPNSCLTLLLYLPQWHESLNTEPQTTSPFLCGINLMVELRCGLSVHGWDKFFLFFSTQGTDIFII